MAIAYDNAASVGGASVASLTTAAWLISGSDRMLIAGVGVSAGTPPTITAVKWGGSGGTALTARAQSGAQETYMRVELWSLAAPTAASQTLYASFSGAADECCLGGISYTGVAQTGSFGTSATAHNNGVGNNPTVNVTSAAGEIVVDAAYEITDALTVGAGQTQRVNQANTGDVTQLGMSEAAGAASVTMDWTHASTASAWEWVTISIPIKPVGAGAAGSILPKLMQYG